MMPGDHARAAAASAAVVGTDHLPSEVRPDVNAAATQRLRELAAAAKAAAKETAANAAEKIKKA